MLFAVIPGTGLLRIDLATASFIVLNHQIYWSSFVVVTGLSLILVSLPVLTYMIVGTAWCGWGCPQNYLTEWADNLTYKLLGKRASVEVGGEGMIVAAKKNKLINWVILGASFLSVSVVLGLIPMLFFFTPKETWQIVTLTHSGDISPFILYLFGVFLIFIDIAVVRYFLCDYACVYRMGQRMFLTRDALHITYDATRAADCTKCNYCTTVCITKIEPTEISEHDICINCGECVDACSRLHQKSGTSGLLDFKMSSNVKARTWYQNVATVLLQTNKVVIAVFVIGVAMLTWGLITQPKPVPKVSQAAQQRAFNIARACDAQCIQQETSCKNRNMEGCYRAAACKCECTLQHDPASPEGDRLKQCVARNTEHADALNLKSTHAVSGKPAL
jgi:polyferredoxin